MDTEALGLRWGSLAAAGAAMIFLGLLSVAFADAAGQALLAFVGWLLLIGGAVHLVGAIRVRAWRGGLMSIMVAGLRVAVGILFVTGPSAWASAIVMLLGIYFLVDGAFHGLLAFQAYPARGWGYILTGACMALLLGLTLVFRLSGEGAFVIGLLFGIHLLFDGWATLMLAAASRAALR